MKKFFSMIRYLFNSDVKDHGKNNAVFVISSDGTRTSVRRACMFGKKHSKIKFHGNNNIVELYEPLGDLRLNISVCNDTKITLMPSKYQRVIKINGVANLGNAVYIGQDFHTTGALHMEVCHTGGDIKIGDNCLFGWNAFIRIGDGHVIFDADTKNVLNKNRDVVIGNHVWFGSDVSVAKGSVIPDDSVVGMRSLVAGRFETPNVVIAGIPARVVKNNINWDDVPYDVYEARLQNK